MYTDSALCCVFVGIYSTKDVSHLCVRWTLLHIFGTHLKLIATVKSNSVGAVKLMIRTRHCHLLLMDYNRSAPSHANRITVNSLTILLFKVLHRQWYANNTHPLDHSTSLIASSNSLLNIHFKRNENWRIEAYNTRCFFSENVPAKLSRTARWEAHFH